MTDWYLTAADGSVRRPKPCLARLGADDGWCILSDGHKDDCLGYPTPAPIEQTDFGPAAAKRRRF